MLRQFDAILGTGSLLRYTRRITAPTVIHGSEDPMVRPRNGRNLAWRSTAHGTSSSTAWVTTCPSRCGAPSSRRSRRISALTLRSGRKSARAGNAQTAESTGNGKDPGCRIRSITLDFETLQL